jgi:hypothetical protein
MAITPLHSSSDTNIQSVQQTKQISPTQQNNALAIAAQNKQQETVQHSQAQPTQAPKPVVNTQGQKTGQILNATA